MTTTTAFNPQFLVTETLNICKELTNLLGQENIAIDNKDIKLVETNVKHKSKLVAKLEGHLNSIKRNSAAIKADEMALKGLEPLQDAIHDYNVHARKNLIKLQARHHATIQFMGMVRQAIVSQQPKAETYTKDGTLVNTPTGRTNLINTQV